MKKGRKINAQKSAIKKVIESSNQEIENNVTKKRERGITLIALVVTIIIMLILAAVTLNMALGDNGLIQMAKFAASKYEEAADNESIAMKGLANGINNPESVAPTTTTTPTPAPEEEKPKIGDVVNYTPKPTQTTYTLYAKYSGVTTDKNLTQEEYTWKIMNINGDGTVEIMGVPTSSMTKVYLKGATGYNNGVYLLNEICKTLYSDSSLGATARSINIDDIESHMTEAGKNERDTFIAGGVNYGETKIYESSNAYYPNIAKYENHVGISDDGSTPVLNTDGITESNDGKDDLKNKLIIPLEDDSSNQEKSKTQGNKIIVKQTHYTVSRLQTYYKELEFCDLIFGSKAYFWLASRCSNCGPTDTGFGLRYVSPDVVTSSNFLASFNRIYEYGYCLAPVVSLGSDIQFSRGENDEWDISKKSNV